MFHSSCNLDACTYIILYFIYISCTIRGINTKLFKIIKHFVDFNVGIGMKYFESNSSRQIGNLFYS